MQKALELLSSATSLLDGGAWSWAALGLVEFRYSKPLRNGTGMGIHVSVLMNSDGEIVHEVTG
jgi:hypothetical protein